MTQRELLRFATVSALIYIGVNFIKYGLFFTSPLLLFIVIYIVLAYIKWYSAWGTNVRLNLVVSILSLMANTVLIVGTNFLGLCISFLDDKILTWCNDCNPFLLVAGIALFNLMRNIHFTNKAINYISSLSLLVYIIHENELLRTYYRPALWHIIYKQFGYGHLIFWLFIMSLVVFCFGVVVSMLYRHTFEKVVDKEADWLLPKIQNLYEKYERIMMSGE